MPKDFDLLWYSVAHAAFWISMVFIHIGVYSRFATGDFVFRKFHSQIQPKMFTESATETEWIIFFWVQLSLMLVLQVLNVVLLFHLFFLRSAHRNYNRTINVQTDINRQQNSFGPQNDHRYDQVYAEPAYLHPRLVNKTTNDYFLRLVWLAKKSVFIAQKMLTLLKKANLAF